MTTSSSTMAGRRALVCGATGQDGAYLSRFLLDRGYTVFGTSRDALVARSDGMASLGIERRVELISMAPNDFRSVLQAIVRTKPDEIYNLAGQTSVGLSFEQPVEAIESIALATLNLLEAIRFSRLPIRLYNAGSSECFGDTGGNPATEQTPFRPRSPYAVAKACAHNLIASYRDAYGMHACTGVLFNHESPLRPVRFVTQKIVQASLRISRGSTETLSLGDLSIQRDWGWAPEYVEAMWRMLQLETPSDLVIATGRTVSLQYFVAAAFGHFGLDWAKHVARDEALLRPSDVHYGGADPSRAMSLLGWRATMDVDAVVKAMCTAAAADR